MASLVSRFWSSASSKTDSKTPEVTDTESPSLVPTLPASWYTSPEIFQLEKEHIFMKSWHLLAPTSVYQTPYFKRQYTFAGVKFFVFKTADGSFRAYLGELKSCFSEEEVDNDGVSLTVSPSVEEYAVKNQLQKVSLHVTDSGLIFFLLDRDESNTFESYYGKDLERILANMDFSKLYHRRTYNYKVEFNWKTLIDGYQECLHCLYAHPKLTKAYPTLPHFYSVENYSNFSRSFPDENDKREDNGLFLYFFPTGSINNYGGGFNMFRLSPISNTECMMEYEYFYDENASDEEFNEWFKFSRQVADEDSELCFHTQKNLNNGFYRSGMLNPIKESGVIFYQNIVRERLLKSRNST